MRGIIHDAATGEIVTVLTAPDVDFRAYLKPGQSWLELEGDEYSDVAPFSHYIQNGAIVEYPPKPSAWHTFDFTKKRWVATLADARHAKWLELKERRQSALVAPFSFNGMTFDADMPSQSNISNAVLVARFSPDVTWQWTMADNSVAEVDATTMIAVGEGLAARTKNIYEHSQSLRVQIDSATTVEEIDAIIW